MAGALFFTVQQASKICELPEPAILGYIQNGELIASFNQGAMSYLVLQDDLVAFMKARKMFAQMQKLLVHRVLVVDRDQNTTFILKTELERGGKVMVKVATSTKDVELSLDANVPDVMTMHLAAVQRQQDNLAGVLRRCRETRPTKLILYHNQPEVLIRDSQDVQKLVNYLKVDAVVSVASGMRPLIQKIEEVLGIVRQTRVYRPPFGPTGGAAAPPPPPPPPPPPAAPAG